MTESAVLNIDGKPHHLIDTLGPLLLLMMRPGKKSDLSLSNVLLVLEKFYWLYVSFFYALL